MNEATLKTVVRAFLPYVKPVALTPAESREFYPALEVLREFAEWPSGPGPFSGMTKEA